MGRNEGAVAFAVMAGGMFLASIMGPIFVYAFNPAEHDALFLVGFAVIGMGLAACLYGVSTILRSLGALAAAPRAAQPAVAAPAAAEPAAPDPAHDELMGDAPAGSAKSFASAQEMMSSVRTLIELENWKLAHQRAFELVEAYPESEEAAKVKKNLDYLQQKAAG